MFPQIRMFREASGTAATPQTLGSGKWEVCSPESVGGFSATAYFFGRELHRVLGVPVGLDQLLRRRHPHRGVDPVGSPEGQARTQGAVRAVGQGRRGLRPEGGRGAYQKQLADFKGRRRPRPTGSGRRGRRRPVHPTLATHHPAGLYNGKIVPLVPYAIRGVIWYQGENNTRDDASGLLYRKQLPLLIRDWRARWGQDFPVGFVQLPNLAIRNLVKARPEDGHVLLLGEGGQASLSTSTSKSWCSRVCDPNSASTPTRPSPSTGHLPTKC